MKEMKDGVSLLLGMAIIAASVIFSQSTEGMIFGFFIGLAVAAMAS